MFFICLFLGYLGVHKFIEKKTGMGVLYLCTLGLFGIGWIVDTIIYLVNGQFGFKKPQKKSAPVRTLGDNEALPIVANANIILPGGEVCHYSGVANYVTVKSRVVGHEADRAGVSVRVVKGVTYHTGGTKGKAIRGNVMEKERGTLFVTNKRVIFVAPNNGFDRKFSELSVVIPCSDGMQLQIKSKTHSFLTNDGTYICGIIRRVMESEE